MVSIVRNWILFLPVAVSYNRKKLRLKWGAGGVTVNPELKLLQYDIGEPTVLEETIDYMLEKNGIGATELKLNWSIYIFLKIHHDKIMLDFLSDSRTRDYAYNQLKSR